MALVVVNLMSIVYFYLFMELCRAISVAKEFISTHFYVTD